jgi:hypothetical protein
LKNSNRLTGVHPVVTPALGVEPTLSHPPDPSLPRTGPRRQGSTLPRLGDLHPSGGFGVPGVGAVAARALMALACSVEGACVRISREEPPQARGRQKPGAVTGAAQPTHGLGLGVAGMRWAISRPCRIAGPHGCSCALSCRGVISGRNRHPEGAGELSGKGSHAHPMCVARYNTLCPKLGILEMRATQRVAAGCCWVRTYSESTAAGGQGGSLQGATSRAGRVDVARIYGPRPRLPPCGEWYCMVPIS